MKKTSIIMLVMAGLVAAASFIAPPILFKKSNGDSNLLSQNVELTGKQSTLSTSIFTRLEIDKAYYLQPESSNDKDAAISPKIEIHESDSITTPLFSMDEGWARNLDITVTDSVCKVIFTPADTSVNTLYYSPQASLVAELTVPKGMLKELSTFPVEVSLYDFQDAVIALGPSTPFKAFNSSFKTLSTP